jgi:hypothetical protein
MAMMTITIVPPTPGEREVVVVPIATTPPVAPDPVGETGSVAVSPAAGPVALVAIAVEVTVTVAIPVAVEVAIAVTDDAVSQIVSIPIPVAEIAIAKSLTQILSISEVAAGLVATFSRPVIWHPQKVADLVFRWPTGLELAASLVGLPPCCLIA